MRVLAVILARAGSKGLPDKCVLPLCGRPILAYTLDHARASERVEAIVVTTDSEPAKAIARAMGVQVVDRPAELATDAAPVDGVVRHAVERYEQQHTGPVDAVVILYGNIPIRREGVIDRCIEQLAATGCDSVRTVAPVGKLHPDWLHRLDGDRLEQYRPNSIDRRQDLEPLYYHDGAVVAVTRAALFAPETAGNPHAFFGRDRRAVLQAEQDAVDIDTIADFYRAEAVLRTRGERIGGAPEPGTQVPG